MKKILLISLAALALAACGDTITEGGRIHSTRCIYGVTYIMNGGNTYVPMFNTDSKIIPCKGEQQ